MSSSNSTIYDRLREDILNFKYKPGEELNINSLSEKLEVSRSPVRDALLLLERDRLVDIFPQRGTRVSLLDFDIIRQERFMRKNLELGVLKACLATLTDENSRNVFATKLQAILVQQEASMLEKDKFAALKHDDEFHHLCYTQTDNEWIWNIVTANTGNEHRVRLLACDLEAMTKNVDDDHHKVLKAIRTGNLEEAIETDKFHLERLTYQLESLKSSFPEYFSN